MKGAGEGEGGERIPIGVISRRYPASLMLTRVPISRWQTLERRRQQFSSAERENETLTLKLLYGVVQGPKLSSNEGADGK